MQTNWNKREYKELSLITWKKNTHTYDLHTNAQNFILRMVGFKILQKEDYI